MSSSGARHTWIDTDAAFEDLCRELANETELALDTESDGFHHYFDKLCLLQLTTSAGRDFLVDVLALTTLDPFRPVLEDPGIRKLLHAAEQDLMYFRRDHDMVLRGLFDTSIAAQFCGYTRLGLATIVEELVGVKLSKASQRDDWSKRPLTPKQLDYAISDTRHLATAARALEQQLESLGRTSWAREEFGALEDKERAVDGSEPADQTDLTRIKGWKELPARGQAVLKELLVARDAEAQRRDRPPFRIAGNTLLLNMAKKPPSGMVEMMRFRGAPSNPRVAARLLKAVESGMKMSPSDFPRPPDRRGRRQTLPARDPEFEPRRDRLRVWRKKKAAELELEPGVVVPQRCLELLADQFPTSCEAMADIDGLRRWRVREFGEEWLAVLHSGS